MYELVQMIPNVEALLALEPEALGGKLLFPLRKRTFQGNMFLPATLILGCRSAAAGRARWPVSTATDIRG